MSKKLYKVSIGRMCLRLIRLQADNREAKKIKVKGKIKEGWENVNEVLHFQGLSYVLEIICLELISWHHDNPLANHFIIKKI